MPVISSRDETGSSPLVSKRDLNLESLSVMERLFFWI